MRSATWGQRLVSVLLIGIAMSIPLAWIVGGYLQFGITELLGFRVEDGFCASGEEPFGAHCFSDFSVITELLAATSLWDPSSATATAYPPSGWLIPFGIYVAAGSLGGTKVATYVFLVIALAATLAPSLWVARGDWIRRAPIVLLAIGLGAAPVLVVLDRGNSTALIVAPLLVFTIGLFRNDPRWIVSGVVVSTLLKPQMILLVVALIALRRYRLSLIAVALSVLGVLASFLVWPGDRIRNFTDWIRNLIGYSDYGTIDVAYPYNLSAARSLLVLSDLSGISSAMGEENRGHLVNLLTRFSSVPGLLLLALAVVILIAKRHQIDPLTAIFVAVSLVIVVPGTSFSYYLVLLVPVAAVILKDPRLGVPEKVGQGLWRGVLDSDDLKSVPGARVRSWTLIVVMTISFSLLAIPLPDTLVPGLVLGDSVGVVQILWGPVLLLGTLVVLMSLVVPGRTTRMSPSSSEAQGTS